MFGKYESLIRYLYGAFNGKALVSLAIAALISVLMRIVSRWRLLSRAGQRGWTGLIPIYGSYAACKAFWSRRAFWVSLALNLCFLMLAAGFARFRSGLGQAGYTACAMGLMALLSALIAFGAILQQKTAAAFGRSGAFAAAITLLPAPFGLYLAFAKGKYEGPRQIGAEKKERAGAFLSCLPVLALGLLLLCGVALTFCLTFGYYTHLDGIFGMRFAGFANLMDALKDAGLRRALRNSALQGLCDALGALLLGFAGALVGRNKYLRASALGLGAGLMLLPAPALEALLLRFSLIQPEGASAALLLAHALPYAGAGLLGGALLCPLWPKKTVYAALASFLPVLGGLLIHSAGAGELLLPGADKNWHTSLFDYFYRAGFVDARISFAAAGQALELMLALLPALLAALALGALNRENEALPGNAKKGRPLSLTISVLCAVLPLAATGLWLLSLGSLSGDARAFLSPALKQGCASLALGFALSFGSLLCLSKRPRQSVWPLMALTALLMYAGRYSSMAAYVLARGTSGLWLFKSLFSCLNPFCLTLLIYLSQLKSKTLKDCALLALGASLTMMAFGAGESGAGLVYLTSRADRGPGLAAVYAAQGGDISGALGLSGLAALLGVLPAALSAGLLDLYSSSLADARR